MATFESKLLLSCALVFITFIAMVATLNYSYNTLEGSERNNMFGYYWVIGFIITLALVVGFVWYAENHLKQ